MKKVLWLIILLGYVVGSIPSAYIAGRWLTGEDIRRLGDGNVGARNAYHELGPKVGVAVFVVDAIKGMVPVLIAQAVVTSQVVVLTAGVAVVIGHNWPLFLGFRGGRGEATTIGVLLILLTQPTLVVAGPALAALLICKNVVIASCILFIPLPLVCWLFGSPLLLVGYSAAVPCLVGVTHFLRTRQMSGVSAGGAA